jgi:hypothetical protein
MRPTTGLVPHGTAPDVTPLLSASRDAGTERDRMSDEISEPNPWLAIKPCPICGAWAIGHDDDCPKG